MRIAVLTGAGISAESGLSTFRDSGGLWEGFDVMEVASIEGWVANPDKVLDFYNLRRKQAWTAKPNPGHMALAGLENYFEVNVITQNVDNLHERGGSKNVLHLHGELRKVKCEGNPCCTFDYEDRPILPGDTCKDGFRLRPDIVWFGEAVPLISDAAEIVAKCDILIVAGTSLVVYPAAGLLDYAPENSSIYLVDPKKPEGFVYRNYSHTQRTAATGLPELCDMIIKKYAYT
jgi:NAD-dependent deacetylase